MKNSDFIVFDFETGGLVAENNPAVQIALITLDNKTLKEKRRWETYIQPYDNLKIEQKALDANGLRMTDINKGITKSELVAQLKDYFLLSNPKNNRLNKPILVGHNVKFDMTFMNYLFKNDKKGLMSFISDVQHDTLLEAIRAFPNETSHKLGDICKLVGIDLVDAHKAMNDVVATADLFRYFTKRLRNTKVESSSTSDKAEKTVKSRLGFQF